MTINQLEQLLRALTPPGRGHEKALQDEIAGILTREKIGYMRERPLSAEDIPDFIVGGIVIEVKTAFSVQEVMRQLMRYAEHAAVAEIMLVTTLSKHRVLEKLSAPLNKKIRVIWVHAL